MSFHILVEPRRRFSELVAWAKFDQVYDVVYAEMFKEAHPGPYVAEVELLRLNELDPFVPIEFNDAPGLLAERGYRPCTARELLEFAVSYRGELREFRTFIALGSPFEPRPEDAALMAILFRENQGGLMLELFWHRRQNMRCYTNGYHIYPSVKIGSDILL